MHIVHQTCPIEMTVTSIVRLMCMWLEPGTIRPRVRCIEHLVQPLGITQNTGRGIVTLRQKDAHSMYIYRYLAGTHAVEPRKTARVIGIVLVVSALVFANTSWGYPLAFVIAPFALIAGTLLGLAVMRSTRFWRDPQDSALWMDSGRTFLVVWGILVAARIVLSIVSAVTTTGPHHTQQPGWVALSGGFLAASMGLWVARGAVIFRNLQSVQAK